MNSRQATVGLALLCAVGLTFSCRFEPDLSRFASCAEDGSCQTGYTCLTEAHRCLPDCGAQGPCPLDPPDGSPGDGGSDEDGGMDAGTDAGLDAGTEPELDGGTDAGSDAGVPLSWATETLALGVETQPYALELMAQGGTPPYQFSATQALPSWLMLDGSALSGTPPAPGTFRVFLDLSDSDTPPSERSAAYDLRVRPLLRVAGPEILVRGYTNNFYTEKISATGGVPPYSFELASGDPPPGLTLFQDGSLTGTPSAAGDYTLQVRVTDSDPQQPQTVVRSLTLSITAAPLLLTLSTESVPDGRMGTAYQYVLRTAPGSNVTWKLKAGALPGGIGFFPSTATISGTPNVTGSYTFTINVTDGLLTNIDRTFNVTVY